MNKYLILKERWKYETQKQKPWMTNKNLNRQDTEWSHNGTAELKSDGDDKYLRKLLNVNTIFQVLDIMSVCPKTQLQQQTLRNRFHIGINAVYMYKEENLSKDSHFRIKIKLKNPPPPHPHHHHYHHHHHPHHEVCKFSSLKTAPLNYRNVLVSPVSPGLLQVTSPPQSITPFQYPSHSKQFSIFVVCVSVHHIWNWREIPTWCNNLFIIINNSTCFGHLYAHRQEY